MEMMRKNSILEFLIILNFGILQIKLLVAQPHTEIRQSELHAEQGIMGCMAKSYREIGVIDGELVCSSGPNGIVIHETNNENLSTIGFYVVVATILCPYLVWG